MSRTSGWEWLAFAIAFVFLCAMVSSCGARYYPKSPTYTGYELR